jgi:hypothetical protein
MFSLQDIKEYWCAVSVNDDGDDVRIMRVSDDLKADDVLSFENGQHIEDTSVDAEWFESWIEDEATLAGVYKLGLEPIYESYDDDGEKDKDAKEPPRCLDYLKVNEVTLLYKLET